MLQTCNTDLTVRHAPLNLAHLLINTILPVQVINFIHQYSALRPVLAGTRTQSGDQYGSGTLHPGQILRGRLPLLSAAFRRSHLLRQVPSRPRRKRPLAAEGGTLRGREMFRQISSRIRLPRNSRDLSHAANLRHGTDGFTSPPKEDVLRIFSS